MKSEVNMKGKEKIRRKGKEKRNDNLDISHLLSMLHS
jgi:hypothetical protein